VTRRGFLPAGALGLCQGDGACQLDLSGSLQTNHLGRPSRHASAVKAYVHRIVIVAGEVSRAPRSYDRGVTSTDPLIFWPARHQTGRWDQAALWLMQLPGGFAQLRSDC